MGNDLVRVIIPDSHGQGIDGDAAKAFLKDLKRLSPDEIVMVGDHLDCGSTFSAHQPNYRDEREESYAADVAACNKFLDAVQEVDAPIDYLEGNHEGHVERWAARTFSNSKDVEGLLKHYGPEKVLKLATRGIKYYRRSNFYQGISVPGTIRKGKCFFTHGICHGKNAAEKHLQKFGASCVFGHVHRSLAVVSRTVTSDAFGAWSPGTLSKLQPRYMHTSPTDWTHGYGVQFVAKSGNFLHINVPIVRGKSLLPEML